MKILVIDDDGDLRYLARVGLTLDARVEVVEAGSGPEGLAAAERERPDGILLDVRMPGMDGPATLAALRANPRTARIPVIFVTASPAQERDASSGAAGILRKPFDPTTLSARVRAILEDP